MCVIFFHFGHRDKTTDTDKVIGRRFFRRLARYAGTDSTSAAHSGSGSGPGVPRDLPMFTNDDDPLNYTPRPILSSVRTG